MIQDTADHSRILDQRDQLETAAERLEVIAHDLVEHTPCGRLRRVRGRRTTRHMGVVANRSPAGAHRGLHRNLYDPLADER